MKIIITGATGLVGKKLVDKLSSHGHHITIVSRNPDKAIKIFNHLKTVDYVKWDSDHLHFPSNILKDASGIIHLMGENIGAKRWSDEQKKKIYDSRVVSTKKIVEAINAQGKHLSFFISASAVGFYPANLNDAIDEYFDLSRFQDSPSFLSKVCRDWEQASANLPESIRRVYLRTSVVLEPNDGALKKMLLPFKMGVGGIIGNGEQVMSWIHVDDLVELYIKAVTDQNFSGAYNATSPNPVSNYVFTKALGQSLKRPTIFPLPSFMVQVAFGEMGSLITDSQKVKSKRLEEIHFQFKYPEINSALNQLLK